METQKKTSRPGLRVRHRAKVTGVRVEDDLLKEVRHKAVDRGINLRQAFDEALRTWLRKD